MILDEDGHANSFNILSSGAIGGCALGFFNTFQHLQVSKATGNRATLHITCVSLGDTNNHGPSQTRAGKLKAMIRWPRTIEVDAAKVSGSLIEAHKSENGQDFALGIGINVNADFCSNSSFAQEVTSMRCLVKHVGKIEK